MHRRVTHLGTLPRKRVGATGSLACCPRRTFSSTRAHHATHYDTLSIPRNATKSQIKSAYYKLSKQFHPDINKEPEAREKFLAFSDAYAILGCDRQRRSYDRSLAASSSGTPQHQPGHHHHHHHYQAPPPYSHYASANEARRRSANYAWERRRRPPPGSNPYAYAHYPRSQHPSASGNPHGRRADPHTLHYRPQRTSWKETELDRVNRVSGLGRAAQLVALFVAGIAVVGTLGKS